MQRSDDINFNEQKAKPANAEILLLCAYCELKETCTRRVHKESYEKDNWVTRCTIAQRRPKKKKSRSKKQRMKRRMHFIRKSQS